MAYQKRAADDRLAHPLTHHPNITHHQPMQALGTAYQILSDPQKRATYDRLGAAGVSDAPVMDAGALFGVLFGSDVFEDYVGECAMVGCCLANVFDNLGECVVAGCCAHAVGLEGKCGCKLCGYGCSRGGKEGLHITPGQSIRPAVMPRGYNAGAPRQSVHIPHPASSQPACRASKQASKQSSSKSSMLWAVPAPTWPQAHCSWPPPHPSLPRVASSLPRQRCSPRCRQHRRWGGLTGWHAIPFPLVERLPFG